MKHNLNKKLTYVMALCAMTYSCKKANVTEIRPMYSSYPDTTKVLLMEDKYPYMKLVTNKAVHLQVNERKSNMAVPLDEDTFRVKVHYLPLETNEDCLQGGIDKLEADDQSIFIFDDWNDKVLRFSQKDGSFMNSFGAKGRGPGEYIRISDMSLNRKKKEVCLIDNGGYKFLYYDYDGQLLREEPMFYYYYKVEFVGDYMVQYPGGSENTMAPSVNHNYLIFARQSDQTPKYVGFPFSEQLANEFGYGMTYPLVSCNGDVYFNHLLSDTIWQIKPNGTCEAKYVFKIPGRDNLFDENDFQNMSSALYEQKTQEAKCYYSDDIRITENFVFARIRGGEDMLYCIPTGHCKYGMFYLKAFGETQLLGNADFLTLNGKSFVKILQPDHILEHIKKEIECYVPLLGKTEEQLMDEWLTEEERQLLQKMTPEDNPILMIIDIEPF